MRIRQKRTILILLLFIVMTTLSLFLCIAFFLSQNQIPQTSFVMQIVDPINFTQSSHSSDLSAYLTNSELSSYYGYYFTKSFPYITITIILILASSFGLFAYCIKRQQHKQQLEIAQNIAKLKEQELHENDDFYQELSQIKLWMTQYQSDYEKLYAYMTHEQKNMLTLMKARCSSSCEPALLQDIQHLQDSMEDLLTLFAQGDDTLEEVDFAYLCALVCDQYRSLYPSLRFSFDEDENYLMMGKEFWIKRALANVIDNAIKYGGQAPIQIQLRVKNNTIICKVIDQGCGIPNKKIQEIFQYRYRIHPLQKDGFGIGLSLVHHVCDLCDGYVWVESEEAKGSCFQLCFPTKH